MCIGLAKNTGKMAQRQIQRESDKNKDTEYSIYVPSLGLNIGKKRNLLDVEWNDQQLYLHTLGLRIPTLYENAEFLRYLYENSDNPEYKQIFDDITKQRNPYRAENFDAYFETVKEKKYISYHIFDSQGRIQKVTEPLEKCLMQNRLPGIDLEEYLLNHTHQGLPKINIKKGRVFYRCPEDCTVARFGAGPKGTDLFCVYPRYSDNELGVRAVAQADKTHLNKFSFIT